MKKIDLKPGVVYYYESRYRGDGPAALLLDNALWKRERPRYSQDRWTYTRDFHTRSNKPESSDPFDRTTWSTGYLMIIGPTEAADALKALTLDPADVVSSLGREIPDMLPEHCELAIIDNRHLTGTYDERVAQIAEQEQRKQAERETADRRHRAILDRHDRIATALSAVLDQEIHPAEEWSTPTGIGLTFEQAERILALLESAAMQARIEETR